MTHLKVACLALLVMFLSYRPIYAQNDSAKSKLYRFQDASFAFEERAKDLVSQLTLEEKLALMQNNAKPVDRLGIPAYNWWNECLHGVARDGVATVFPQAIAFAATWNPALVYRVADAISTEARAKHEEHIRKGERKIYQGLTMWTPNINIFRDPRWGRGQETYGEDPFLTARTGVAFVKGLQGNDPTYFKVIATAKHYAVHSGSEYNRHVFDAVVSKADMFDTYLPAFEALVKEGKVYSVMGAYNRINGVPACASNFLLDTVLRKKWGFKGYVVSDCGAIGDIYQHHHYAKSQPEASALAVKAGCDLTCGGEYTSMMKAVENGIITEKELDVSVNRLMLALFKLGMFDDNVLVKYKQIPYSENNTPEHDALAKQTALESMVLLQNKSKILPLSLSGKQATVAVVGPFANDKGVLNGNYNGTPALPVTFLQGIQSKQGSSATIITNNFIKKPELVYASKANKDDSVAKLVEACKSADVVIFCGGISSRVEGEESKLDMKGFYKGDRTSLDLPEVQLDALKALKAAGKKVVLVTTNGSALALNWENENLDAIVEAWYPGQQGGNALADILTGAYNPTGRLPITFYKTEKDLPAFEDYDMKGRTYRYFTGKPLYPFGYGLSYSSFSYTNAKLSQVVATAKDSVSITVKVKNVSTVDGGSVVQLYATAKNIHGFRPVKVLIGFKKAAIKAGNTEKVSIKFAVASLRQYDETKNEYVVYPGDYAIGVGESSGDIKLDTRLKVN
ncbi:glycoside hydrolase family 3 C-terminal domain-containing protein [Parasediminibacterium sp. JCM 36343]|uniref:glycoside hydrolase family 3 C-terminal domain-containing protein n=1 Tax=Parasediminibacterium sp. JCM 36343 TaxID=3374279 RepID=UPI00397B1A03